ncbi:hypothetical protein [African swine fever virus]|uniref:I9R n=1 Tax=African swine fever virus TaxID=10497 RepID=A0A894ZTR8_ASF|nr:I9R [African swine fever virus]
MGTFSVTASAKNDNAVCKYLKEPMVENKNYKNIFEHDKKNLNDALRQHITVHNPVVDWCNNYSTFSSQDFEEYKIYIHSDLMDGRPSPKKTWCVII